MTHRELVIAAKLWLKQSKGCNPVFTEKGSNGCAEIPDAIGWTASDCILVEAKTSKSDLIANGKKTLLLGNLKYFIMTNALYLECEQIIPEGWGVITAELHGRVSQVRFRNSIRFESDARSEIRYLRSRILSVQEYGR